MIMVKPICAISRWMFPLGGKHQFIIGTREMRKAKLGDEVHSIIVEGKVVPETKSERLLGVVMNNTMTWSDHLHGEHWRIEDNSPGLIPQLSQRVGLIRKLEEIVEIVCFCPVLLKTVLLPPSHCHHQGTTGTLF